LGWCERVRNDLARYGLAMESSCWITFESDRALQARLRRGDFGKEGKLCLPIQDFPAAPNCDYWIVLLTKCCRDNGVELTRNDIIVSARVKKRQIQDFIECVFAGDPSYSDPAKMLTWQGRAYLSSWLTDLRAFVAQQLSPRLWYEIHADEF